MIHLIKLQLKENIAYLQMFVEDLKIQINVL